MNKTDSLRAKKLFRPLDVFVLLAAAGAGAWFVYETTVALDYNWKWSIIPQYLLRTDEASGELVPGLLLQGLFTTLRLSLWGGLVATVLGLVFGLMRVSPKLFFRQLSVTYVELVRNTPPLVIVFVFYFFIGDQILTLLSVDRLVAWLSTESRTVVPFLFGPVEQLPQFVSATITIGLFEGAYIAEIVRAGVESVEKGQWEASASQGLSRYQQLRHIVLPQALRRMLPALAGQFISTIKDSSIVAIISIQELTFQGLQIMAATYRTFEVWITILALYFVLTFICSTAVDALERKLNYGRPRL